MLQSSTGRQQEPTGHAVHDLQTLQATSKRPVFTTAEEAGTSQAERLSGAACLAFAALVGKYCSVLLFSPCSFLVPSGHAALVAHRGWVMWMMLHSALLFSNYVGFGLIAHAALVTHMMGGLDDAAVVLCITVLGDLPMRPEASMNEAELGQLAVLLRLGDCLAMGS
ncbi:TPA: hypothetical protein ACH3X1_013551 [Trebouxia sp. C0004]